MPPRGEPKHPPKKTQTTPNNLQQPPKKHNKTTQKLTKGAPQRALSKATGLLPSAHVGQRVPLGMFYLEVVCFKFPLGPVEPCAALVLALAPALCDALVLGVLCWKHIVVLAIGLLTVFCKKMQTKNSLLGHQVNELDAKTITNATGTSNSTGFHPTALWRTFGALCLELF